MYRAGLFHEMSQSQWIKPQLSVIDDEQDYLWVGVGNAALPVVKQAAFTSEAQTRKLAQSFGRMIFSPMRAFQEKRGGNRVFQEKIEALTRLLRTAEQNVQQANEALQRTNQEILACCEQLQAEQGAMSPDERAAKKGQIKALQKESATYTLQSDMYQDDLKCWQDEISNLRQAKEALSSAEFQRHMDDVGTTLDIVAGCEQGEANKTCPWHHGPTRFEPNLGPLTQSKVTFSASAGTYWFQTLSSDRPQEQRIMRGGGDNEGGKVDGSALHYHGEGEPVVGSLRGEGRRLDAEPLPAGFQPLRFRRKSVDESTRTKSLVDLGWGKSNDWSPLPISMARARPEKTYPRGVLKGPVQELAAASSASDVG